MGFRLLGLLLSITASTYSPQSSADMYRTRVLVESGEESTCRGVRHLGGTIEQAGVKAKDSARVGLTIWGDHKGEETSDGRQQPGTQKQSVTL
jgi:hypothetical protein